ncbi:MAG: hypothetical protein KF745_11530 [Phycisphaeraceae bacterium]|nr:hypothetical protein [Phycisphaeraceae bacterium]
MSAEESLTTIADRQASVTHLVAECDLDLTDSEGQSVRVDGVIVAELPGKMRMRAWKFGHAVFDLTVTDDGAWLMTPEEEQGGRRLDAEHVSSTGVRDVLGLLGPGYFRTARPVRADASMLIACGAALGRDDVVCEIVRATLAPRRFVMGSGASLNGGEVVLDQYQAVDGAIWPMRVRIRSQAGEVVVRVRQLEINGELPPGAFVPSQRARAIP